MRNKTVVSAIALAVNVCVCTQLAGAQPAGAYATPPGVSESSDTHDAGCVSSEGEPPCMVHPVGPITTLDRAQLERPGLPTLGDILQRLPAQLGGANAQINNGGSGETRVDLRGLGASRTLVLLDGRRLAPGGLGGDDAVDVNAIPLAMIERVEILGNGGSVRYGAGAIGGAVNLIQRDELDGGVATLYSGTSSRGDGVAYDASVAAGASLGRASVLVAAGFQRQEPVFAGERTRSAVDREFDYVEGMAYNTGSPSIPSGVVLTSQVDRDGDGLPDAPLNLCGLTPAGVPIAACRRSGGEFVPYDDLTDRYNYQPENYLLTPSQRATALGRARYQLSNGTRAFLEGSYLNRSSSQRLAADPFLSTTPVSAQSVYNPLGVTLLGYQRRLTELGPRRSAQDVDTFRLIAGLEGTLPAELPGLGGFTWQVAANGARSRSDHEDTGYVDPSRLASALGPSYFDANGVARCGPAASPIEGCVPIDLLGGADAQLVTPEMANYITSPQRSRGANDLMGVAATARGLAYRTGAGELSVRTGVESRRERGARSGDAANTDSTAPKIAALDGAFTMTEAHLEMIASQKFDAGPLHALELSLGSRGYHLSTSGPGATWSAGALLRGAGGVALRGAYSTAIRTPSVFELYEPTRETTQLVRDPCDARGMDPTPDAAILERCARDGVPANTPLPMAPQLTTLGGNRDLDPETAKIFTAGVVVTPPATPGLRVSVDYFDVRLTDEIRHVSAAVLLQSCYVHGSSEACSAIHRDPSREGAILSIDDVVRNAGGRATSGLDLAVDYDRTYRFGRLRHTLDATHLRTFELDNTLSVISARDNYLLGVRPSLKANLATTWSTDEVNAGVALHYVSGFDECERAECAEDFPARVVDASLTGDVFAGYTLRTRAGVTGLTLGVNNVLDQAPPAIYSGVYGDSDAATYDYRGRFAYVRLTQEF
ncbi:MAG: TonB-dependent receptor [Kofleriaceae bacterium]